MGCATSKQKPVCRNCKEALAPIPRSYSMHVHHPPQRQGDTYHVVSLTSTTLNSLELDSFHQNDHIDNNAPIDDMNICDETDEEKINKDFSMGMIEAKSWSKMIDEKIPKVTPRTPIQTPPGEPETINTWELMEGLEDTSPLHHRHFRSFSFGVGPNSVPSLLDYPTPKVQENGKASPRPLWMEIAENESESNSNSDGASIVSEFDPDIITQLKKSLEELPPANPFHLKSFVSEKEQALAGNNEASDLTDSKSLNGYKHEVFAKEKVVLYFTSLRGVRKTYEDCCHVRVILKGLNIKVDERDVSMHSGFKEELKELMEDGFSGGCLPRVFVGKKYIGGAEEIRGMNEEGQLEKMIEGCEMVDNGNCGGGGGGEVCEGCGDVRFVPCETCSGSCKIYYEADYDDEEECEEGECGFQRCPDCNENGLIRCPFCCD